MGQRLSILSARAEWMGFSFSKAESRKPKAESRAPSAESLVPITYRLSPLQFPHAATALAQNHLDALADDLDARLLAPLRSPKFPLFLRSGKHFDWSRPL